MICLGVHFSLSDAEVDHLLGIGDDGKRLHYFRQKIEPVYFADYPERLVEDGTAWDAMHRALAGEAPSPGESHYPLDHVVLGGTSLFAGEAFIMRLKAHNQVEDVAKAIPAITHSEFHRRYRSINAADYGGALNNEDFEQTWHVFETVRTFWLRAAEEERFVLFTAEGRTDAGSPI